MTAELLRFARHVSPDRLSAVLSGADYKAFEATGFQADLSDLRGVAGDLIQHGKPGSWWDGHLVEPLHQALHHLPRRILLDMRLWQWICCSELSSYVWYRWYGSMPERPAEVLTSALSERFLGVSTLRGVNRNALSRLYWCADALISEDEGYLFARKALENQDFFQAMFERAVGLHPPALRACLQVLENASEDDRRAALRRLNHYLTTIAAEVLDEQDIRNLLVG